MSYGGNASDEFNAGYELAESIFKENHMFKELLISVDISSAASVMKSIDYLYSIMPAYPDELEGDLALMNLDYASGDPYKESNHA
jgi:hypothetical protein